MTKSTPDIPILDDDAVAEIEARLKRWDRGEISKQTFPVNWKNAAALCQTIRALRAKHEWLRSKIAWHRDGVGPDVPVLQERYDKLIAQRNDLRSRLEQVTKERDDARSGTQRICTHPNTYPFGTSSRRCHDCGLEILL